MTKFQDDVGRLWRVELTDEAIAQIKDRSEVDLSGKVFPHLFGTDELIEKLGRINWILLESQAVRRMIQPKDFAIALGVGGIIRAHEALAKEFIKRGGRVE